MPGLHLNDIIWPCFSDTQDTTIDLYKIKRQFAKQSTSILLLKLVCDWEIIAFFFDSEFLNLKMTYKIIKDKSIHQLKIMKKKKMPQKFSLP